MKNWIALSTLTLCLTLWGTASLASPEHHRKPPQAAFTSCSDANEGDAVTFILDNGDEITGLCQMRKGTLVAVPEHHPDKEMERRSKHRESHRRLPKAAFTACEGMSEGDYVTFVGKSGQMVEAKGTSVLSKLFAKPIDANIE